MIEKNTKAGGIPLNKQNAADFSQGSIGSRIMAQAIPLSLAEIVQLLYNIVDRIFLGHLPDGNTLALTGVGLIFPVVSIVGGVHQPVQLGRRADFRDGQRGGRTRNARCKFRARCSPCCSARRWR